MRHVRELAPEDYLAILEDSYAFERQNAAKALTAARRMCRRNLRRRNNFSLRLALVLIAVLLFASGAVCALFLPLELPARLLIVCAACVVGILSAVFALRI